MTRRPILVCDDGSVNARQAIARAAELFPGGRALILNVWEPLKDVASVPSVPGLSGALREGLNVIDSTNADLSQKTAEEGAIVAAEAGLDAEPVAVSAPGRVWRNILAVAVERDAAAIVVGQRGIGGAERALLGSVSTALVHHADRPIVVVPAEADGS